MIAFQRKTNRLPGPSYEGNRILSITLCCQNRRPLFTSADAVNYHLQILRPLLLKYKAILWAYCFMPDHVHFLIEGGSGKEILDLVKLYKQMTGYRYKQQTGQNLWQKSWIDHVLRREEDVGKVAYYILGNPERKGLVADWRKYPFLGSPLT